MTVIKDLKQELKGLAKQVSETKAVYRQLQKDKQPFYAKFDEHLRLRREYRYKHVAYCLVRGKTYEQIENPKESNRLNMSLVYRYVASIYKQMLDQCSDDYRVVYDVMFEESVAVAKQLKTVSQPWCHINAPADRLQPYELEPKPVKAADVTRAVQTFVATKSMVDIVKDRKGLTHEQFMQSQGVRSGETGSEQTAASGSSWSWLSSVFTRTRK